MLLAIAVKQFLSPYGDSAILVLCLDISRKQQILIRESSSAEPIFVG